jgi:hypothetical protein
VDCANRPRDSASARKIQSSANFPVHMTRMVGTPEEEVQCSEYGIVGGLTSRVNAKSPSLNHRALITVQA